MHLLESAGTLVVGVASLRGDCETTTQSKKKPSAYEFRAAYERALEHDGFTGEVIWRMHYNQGVMTKASPFKPDAIMQK